MKIRNKKINLGKVITTKTTKKIEKINPYKNSSFSVDIFG